MRDTSLSYTLRDIIIYITAKYVHSNIRNVKMYALIFCLRPNYLTSRHDMLHTHFQGCREYDIGYRAHVFSKNRVRNCEQNRVYYSLNYKCESVFISLFE